MKKIILFFLIASNLFMSACSTDNRTVSSDTRHLSESNTNSAFSSYPSSNQTSLPESISPENTYPEKIDEYEKILNSMEGSIITKNSHSETYFSVGDYEFANVYAKDKAYSLRYDSSGAGGSYYKLFYTTDCGKTWNETDKSVRLTNSYHNHLIPIENGTVLNFSNTSLNDNYDTSVTVYGSDKENDSFFIKEIKNWFEIFNIDDSISFVSEVKYNGDYYFQLTIKDKYNEKDVLFDGTVKINEKTLLPEKIISEN